MPQIENLLVCMCVFVIWFGVLDLYMRYSQVKAKIVKAKIVKNYLVDEGGRWLCTVRQLFYLRGFIKRVLSSCGLDTARSVELISFYLCCVNAEMWDFIEKLAESGFIYPLFRLLSPAVCLSIFFFFFWFY